MTPQARSRLLLGATLVLGMVLGILLINVVGMLLGPPPGPGPGGFVGEMERIIEPRDAAQRDAIRPALEAVDERNREILDETRAAMIEALVEMRAVLAPRLDERQLARLDEFIESRRADPPPGPRPPGGPPPRRGAPGPRR